MASEKANIFTGKDDYVVLKSWGQTSQVGRANKTQVHACAQTPRGYLSEGPLAHLMGPLAYISAIIFSRPDREP